jgi:hypothetical protein
LGGVEIYETINQSGKKQRHKKQHRPFRDTEFHEEEREVNNEDQICKIKLEYVFGKEIGISVETCEYEKYG